MALQSTEGQITTSGKRQWKLLHRQNQAVKDAEQLRKHITGTYTWLRYGIVAIAFLLPWVLWFVGKLLFHQSLLGSMSAYYRSPMRDVFVGALWAIGSFLILYKGYSDGEDFALFVAGISAILVALFPLDWTPGWFPTDAINPHGFFAMLLFLCIAGVCWFSASDTLGLTQDVRLKRRYKRIYKILGIAMAAVPIGTWIFVQVADLSLFRDTEIFWLEAGGISIFGAYWAVKSFEIQVHTKAEEKALNLQARKDADGVQPEPLNRSLETYEEVAKELKSNEAPAPTH